MDPPQISFTSRWHSSMINTRVSPSYNLSASPAPRNTSTWDSFLGPSHHPMASDISGRRPSETTAFFTSQALGISNVGNIATRNASAWDVSATAAISSARASATDIARRRATILHRTWWDAFAGAAPAKEGSTWGWMSDIFATTSATSPASPSNEALPLEKTRVFYAGNINYIFENYYGKRLAMSNIEAIMYVYGVKKTGAHDIVKKIDPQKRGIFNINSHNKQILLHSAINFYTKDPFKNLKHASNCYQKKLLSPLHFAAYIFEVLKGRYLGNEPRFIILGMYSILGVLEGSTNRLLTTDDVETFTNVWRLLNPNEAKDIMTFINDNHNGAISCTDFYKLLHSRNWLGKQRIQMYDSTLGQPQNPSLFFPLIEKGEDGLLSSADLRSFAAIFGHYPTDEEIDCVICKLDTDGDGKINLEDFRRAMVPILDGITWDFWLVAILLT